MIISEKHLRKVIREIIIESDEDNQSQTSFEKVLNQVINKGQSEEEKKRNQLTYLSRENETGITKVEENIPDHSLQSLIDRDRKNTQTQINRKR
tara:strand:- start:26713 stop:26994 length:282 start_codon:yes stop_codon:yes gene_type:complete